MNALFAFLFIFLHLTVNADFASLKYSTDNIGDDFQGIAAKNFLPENSVLIDREFLNQFNSEEPINTILNGWFMHSKDCCWQSDKKAPTISWPPSDRVNPLLISMHLTPHFFSKVLNDEGIQYLRKYAPVGARDFETLRELEKLGVPSYFSGCLCLTMDNEYRGARNIIYAVDVGKNVIRYIRSKTKNPVIVLTHKVPLQIQYDTKKRLKHAEDLLKKYRTAKCVVTRRLYATMPCLAFETPVLLIADPKKGKFDGLGRLAHTCSEKDLINDRIDYDFNNPPDNPKDYIPIRDQLNKIVNDWVIQNR